MTISVIVPALDEATRIGKLIAHVSGQGFEECIVVDGGSSDGTPDIVRAHSCARLIEAPRGRGLQLNAGAAAARGDILLFLHADTMLPDGAAGAIAELIEDSSVAGGCFRMGFDSRHPLLSLYGWFTRFDCRFTTFGDQAFFMRRSAYAAAGGFPPWPFLEDVEMRRRLRCHGRFVKLPDAVTTSARRYHSEGFVRRQFLNAAILLLHRFGMMPERLARLYRPQRPDR